MEHPNNLHEQLKNVSDAELTEAQKAQKGGRVWRALKHLAFSQDIVQQSDADAARLEAAKNKGSQTTGGDNTAQYFTAPEGASHDHLLPGVGSADAGVERAKSISAHGPEYVIGAEAVHVSGIVTSEDIAARKGAVASQVARPYTGTHRAEP
jgi:hypothetical protein